MACWYKYITLAGKQSVSKYIWTQAFVSPLEKSQILFLRPLALFLQQTIVGCHSQRWCISWLEVWHWHCEEQSFDSDGTRRLAGCPFDYVRRVVTKTAHFWHHTIKSQKMIQKIIRRRRQCWRGSFVRFIGNHATSTVILWRSLYISTDIIMVSGMPRINANSVVLAEVSFGEEIELQKCVVRRWSSAVSVAKEHIH